MVELHMNMTTDRKTHVINTLDRIVNHPLNRRYNHSPFN